MSNSMKRQNLGRMEAFRKGREEGTREKLSQFGKKITVSLDRLVEDEKNERKTFDEGELKELGDSIREHGLLEPLRVFEIEGDKYQIHTGHRRFRAITKYTDLKKVDIIIAERGDETDSRLKSIVTNNFQIPPNPIESATALQAIIDDPENGIENQVQLSKKIGKSRMWIQERIKLLSLPEPLQIKIVDSELTSGSAKVLRDISRLDNQAEQEAYIERLISGDSGRTIRTEIQEKKTRKGSLPPKPSGTKKKYVPYADDSLAVIIQSKGEGELSQNEQIVALQRALEQMK